MDFKKLHTGQYRFFILACIASMDFYSPSFLSFPSVLYKFLYYFAIAIIGVLTLGKANVGLVDKRYFVIKVIKLLLISLLLSALNADLYENQPFGISVIATLQRVGFLLFIFLCKSKLSVIDIERAIKVLAYCYMIAASINYISGYGIFGEAEFDTDRGGMRLRLLGLDWVQLFLLLSVNKYMLYKQKRCLINAFLCCLFILLSLTRQVIAITLVTLVILVMVKAKMYQKFLIVLILSGFMIFVLPKISIYQKMVEKTESQVNMNKQTDDVRIVAFNYYTFEYPRNLMQKLFGVGVPSYGNSQYGIRFERETQQTRLFRDDVGYAGFYFDHGLIGLGLLLFAIIYSMLRKTDTNVLYSKYFLFMVLLESIASAPFFYSILPIVASMYLIAIKSNVKNKKNNFIKSS